jgi:homoserine O-acetyltransferase
VNDDDDFASADSVRSASPLRHAQTWWLPGPFALERGGTLAEVAVCFETWGTLNERRDNAVLICHALSGDSHVARHDADDDPGWWDDMVGPGGFVDTDRWFVICSNALGGCRGTTGPNFTNPATGDPYGADFPMITVGDMVRVQAALVEHLGIGRLHAVVGGSLGGFQAQAWATLLPQRVRGCVAVATSPRLTAQGLAFDVVGRNAIRRDPDFRDGQYYGERTPETGLAIARMLAHITYLSSESMERKFDATRLRPRDVKTTFEKNFSVGSYLAHQGSKFVERFDANSYITLSTAMDLFDLGATRDELRRSLAPAICRWLLVSFSSDWLYPAAQCRLVADALLAEGKPVSFTVIDCDGGHDAFLLAPEIAAYGPAVGSFLAHLAAAPTVVPPVPDGARANVTSIFHGERLDYELILGMVPPGASVLDVGCGTGELLTLLRERGAGLLAGVELDQRAVAACIGRGLDVLQADVQKGLSAFSDGRFDVAILSQTLQSVEDVSAVLDELVRIARRAIVSFPNFAFKPLREMFFREGKLPKEPGPYAYDWYDTPNRRFPSIIDFQELCAHKGLHIEEEIYIDSRRGCRIGDDPNLNADIAIVAISR